MHLKQLCFYQASLSNLDPLANLKELNVLEVGYSGVADIDAVKNLTSLRTLHLDGNDISDISNSS